MKNFLYIIAFYFISIQVSKAQQMPLEFSNSNNSFNSFSGSGFSFNTNPQDGSDAVGQFFNDGSTPWQGFYIDLTVAIDLNTQQVINLSFYQFDPNTHNIMVKLENGTNQDVEVVQSTLGTGWANDLVFDFSTAKLSGTNTTINATGSYTRLVIYIDGGVASPGTYLIDDINNGSIAVDPNTIDVEYTELIWSDEFDIDGVINPINWFQQTQIPAGGNWYNGEQQHYTNRIENAFVSNGFLNIVAKKEIFTDQGHTKQYTSARLNSKFAFTYGRVDVRAKLPLGDGTWPAIWTLGKNINEDGAYWDSQYGNVSWPACGEIDIMEHGLGAVNHVSSALHTPCDGCFGGTMNTSSMVISDVANNFHIYSVNWSPNQITFLIDGVAYYTYNPAVKDNTTWPFYEDQYMLLNVAMGGVAGTIDPNFTQSEMVIDYVRVYQENTLGILENSFSNAVIVSPNPASTHLNITSKETLDFVVLYDVLGRLVMTKKQNVKTLNVQNLTSGVYVLKMYSGNKSTSKKVVIN